VASMRNWGPPHIPAASFFPGAANAAAVQQINTKIATDLVVNVIVSFA